jgi:hypothetical protein
VGETCVVSFREGERERRAVLRGGVVTVPEKQLVVCITAFRSRSLHEE